MHYLFKVVVAVAGLAACQKAFAAEPESLSTETRMYDILVDGKKSGTNKLTITPSADGTETVTADCKVSVSWVVFTYVYEFHGKEQWRQGRLEQLASRAVDGGRQMSLKVARAGRGYTITKNNRMPEAGPDIQLTTNYWREPIPDPQGRPLTVLDADNGKLYELKLERLGTKDLTIAGERLPATGYRLSGNLDVELWFDAQGILVRQVGEEDGHPTEVHLASVQRTASAPRPRER